jgi:hypothetical protein
MTSSFKTNTCLTLIWSRQHLWKLAHHYDSIRALQMQQEALYLPFIVSSSTTQEYRLVLTVIDLIQRASLLEVLHQTTPSLGKTVLIKIQAVFHDPQALLAGVYLEQASQEMTAYSLHQTIAVVQQSLHHHKSASLNHTLERKHLVM